MSNIVCTDGETLCIYLDSQGYAFYSDTGSGASVWTQIGLEPIVLTQTNTAFTQENIKEWALIDVWFSIIFGVFFVLYVIYYRTVGKII